MRELVSLSDEQLARRFAAYLAVQAVQSSVEKDEGHWIVWINNDDDRERAAEMLAEFQHNPNDEKYENAERKVRQVLREADRLRQEISRKQVDLKKRWNGSWWHCYPATYVIIGICIVVALLCTDWTALQGGAMGPVLCNNRDSKLLSLLGVQTPVKVVEEDGVRVELFTRMPDFPPGPLTLSQTMSVLKAKLTATVAAVSWTMRNGEFWRPVTPIFLHFGLLHILFNMMWLRAMGTAIEFVRGTGRFVLLCLILAVTSNIAQLFWAGPFFGGMSGVVFGLIGYVWMKGKTQPQLGIGLMQQTVVFSVLWLVLCMVGAFGPIANAAHLMGFATGILIGARQFIWKKIPFTK